MIALKGKTLVAVTNEVQEKLTKALEEKGISVIGADVFDKSVKFPVKYELYIHR